MNIEQAGIRDFNALFGGWSDFPGSKPGVPSKSCRPKC